MQEPQSLPPPGPGPDDYEDINLGQQERPRWTAVMSTTASQDALPWIRLCARHRAAASSPHLCISTRPGAAGSSHLEGKQRKRMSPEVSTDLSRAGPSQKAKAQAPSPAQGRSGYEQLR